MNKCSLSKFVAAQIGDSKRLFCQGILQYAFTALFLAPIPSMTVNAAENTANLTILGPDYPRAFFFRACESGPSNKRMTYEKWAAEFGRLSGIIGKCLDEEVLGREANNPEWFSRFKRDYPNQVVLLHFNGNARDPLYKTEKYFSGHWIYRKATLIISDVPATSGETVIKVENVRDFHVGTGRYRTSNDDIALFGVTPDGKHDWNYCEQVQLISVDQNASTIRVKRGCYGTKPLAFKAGKARAAAHQTEGPWGKNNHLLWFYNFTTHCPRDAEGKTCADRLLDDLAAWFGKGGKLEAFDGIEFDVMFNVTRGDTNGDGEEDNGIIGDTNQYGIGMVEFARQLRKQLGPNRIIQGDGALGPGGVRSQRAFNILNGIESEGWPNIHDWKFDDWSGGLNRHAFWHANSHQPAFSYINHKWIEPDPGNPGETRNPDVPFSSHRLVFAAGQFTDSMICYSFRPPANGGGQIAIWDELVCGTANKPGWLGKPQGEAVHLAATVPDNLGGIGAQPSEALAKRITGDVNARLTNDGIIISPAGDKGDDLDFSISDVPVAGEDLVVFVTMKGSPRKGYPVEMARYAEVGIASGGLSLTSPNPGMTGMALRGAAEQPIDPASGARVTYSQSVKIGNTSLPAYSVHPPFTSGKGYVFWCADVKVPPNSELRFQLGMGEKSPQRSDGVWFSVLAAPIADGKASSFTKIFEESTKAHAWLARSVSLADWANQRIRLKFVADCGPMNNATTDHGFWGDVKIVRTNIREEMLTPPKAYMTWLNDRFFASTFYFRKLRSKTVDLTFHIEGSEPVTIQKITAHSHPDAMYRIFENGIVLANPGHSSYAFDLAKLSPGRSYRRLQATAGQDTQANNGENIGATVTLGPLEGLFLLRTDNAK